MRNHRWTAFRVDNLAARNRHLHKNTSVPANKADLTGPDKKGQSIASRSGAVIQRECGLLWLGSERGTLPTGSTAACWDTLTGACLNGMSVCTRLYSAHGSVASDFCFFSLISYLIVCMSLSRSVCMCVFICRPLCVCVCVCLFRRDVGLDQMTTTREEEESRP